MKYHLQVKVFKRQCLFLYRTLPAVGIVEDYVEMKYLPVPVPE